MTNHQPTPRCLAWIEGQGRCGALAYHFDEYVGPYCEIHERVYTEEWMPCRECNRWSLPHSEEALCQRHGGSGWLWPDHPAAERGLEATEALVSWLRAAVESRPSAVDLTPRDAHRAYVARHGCPWAKGTCEPCREEAATVDLYDPERDFDLAYGRATDYHFELLQMPLDESTQAARAEVLRRWANAIRWTRLCVRSDDNRSRISTLEELYAAAVQVAREARGERERLETTIDLMLWEEGHDDDDHTLAR